MASVGFPQQPMGLKPVSRDGSSPQLPAYKTAYINLTTSTNLGLYEPVQLGVVTSGYISAPAADTPANPTANQSLNAEGIFLSVAYETTVYPGYQEGTYWVTNNSVKSGTYIKAQICNDPEQLYLIQCNSVAGITIGMLGQYANLIGINTIDGSANGTGGIVIGQSTAALNLATLSSSPTAANGGRFDVIIEELASITGNGFGVPYGYAIVKFNSIRN